jgi:hypothetical protein
MSLECSRLLLNAVRNPDTAAALNLRAWDDLLRLARRANLISRLATRIEQAGVFEAVPKPVRPHLVAALVLARHQRQAVIWEVRHIAAALMNLDMPVVFLKGAAYSVAGLQAATGRLYGDVDILVPEARINEVEAALMLHGWTAGQTDPYDDRYYRQWMHELPPMVNRKRGTVVDIHHNILPRTAGNHPSASKLVASAVALSESPFYVLSPCDMVIHGATHLFHEGELQNGLRDLFDLDALVTEFAAQDPAFWSLLPARAAELDLVWPLRLALRYLEQFLDTPIPAETKKALHELKLANRLHDMMYLPGFLPDHPLCNDRKTAMARSLLYLRGHWLRMPPLLLALHLGRKAFMRLYKNTSRRH